MPPRFWFSLVKYKTLFSIATEQLLSGCINPRLSEALTRRDPDESTHSPRELFDCVLQTPAIVTVTEDSLIENEEDEGNRGERAVDNPRIQRYLIAVEYVGTGFFGVQQQPNCSTVCGVLEDAFQRFIGQPVSITCSSRTDSGVHALSNVFHVDVERVSKRRSGEALPPYEAAVVRKAVNHFLQKNEGDLSLIDVRSISRNFHARFNAKERTYFCRLLSGMGNISIFEKERAWHVDSELDISSLQKACQVLVGTHDFSSFRAAGCQANSPVRTLDELNITEVSPSPLFPTVQQHEQGVGVRDFKNKVSHSSSGTLISRGLCKAEIPKCQLNQNFGLSRMHRCYVVTARGRSFLYHQYVGTGHLTIPDVERILKAKDVTVASPMAPACGLYLENVGYDFSEDSAST